MNCPFCAHQDTKVIDSRLIQEDNSIRRRRKCDNENCSKRFTTYEKMEISMPMVVKNDGRRETFSSEKVTIGIKKSCQKRPVSMSQIEATVDLLKKTILEQNDGKEVTSKEIGNLVMDLIHDLDPVAYVRFASVYRSFKDIDDFVNNLRSIK